LKNLDDEYCRGLKTCAMRDIVVSHDFFAYPARRYGLKNHPVRGLSTDEEVSPKKLAEFIGLINKNGIKFLFREPLQRDKDIETLAHETGAQALDLNSLESPIRRTDEARKNNSAQDDYLSVMNENLATLKRALKCK
jgi:zinc transport system substrate-binding protein